ncbi:MAG: hypothetical protein ACRDJ9_06435 [Dehalococcoidia bacterium]
MALTRGVPAGHFRYDDGGGGQLLYVLRVVACPGGGRPPRRDRRRGLYCCGLAFQRAFGSTLISGVGKDADYFAKHIAAREPHRSPVAERAG